MMALRLPIGAVADAVCGPIPPRSDHRWHVTDLIRRGDRIAGKTLADFSNMEGAAELGRMWEAMARPLVQSWAMEAGMVANWAPVISDGGIAGSLDGILTPGLGSDTPRIVVEMKLRFTSATADGRGPEWVHREVMQNRHWMQQVKSYCWLASTRHVMFLVLFIGSRPPGCSAWWVPVSFTTTDIGENWTMLQNIKRWAEKTENEG